MPASFSRIYSHPLVYTVLLSGWLYGGIVAAQYITAFTMGLVTVWLTLLFNLNTGIQPVYLLSASALMYGIALAVVVGVPMLFGKWASWRSVSQLLAVRGKFHWRSLGWVLPAYVLYMGAAIGAVTLISNFFVGFDPAEQQNVGFTGLMQIHEYIAAFIALVVCAPIAEELLFRGFLYSKLRSKLSSWVTSLVVSLLFGFVHGQWNVAIDTFFLSLALCFLREKTGAIWTSILLHALKNAIAYYFLFVQPVAIV